MAIPFLIPLVKIAASVGLGLGLDWMISGLVFSDSSSSGEAVEGTVQATAYEPDLVLICGVAVAVIVFLHLLGGSRK